MPSLVKYQPERARSYLGSPSLVRLPGGALVAAHDYFGPGAPRNHESSNNTSSVYRSEDDGATWECVNHLSGAWWSNLFWHRDALYLLGTSAEYGSIVIRRSDDGGFTWTHPADARSGVLFPGGPQWARPNYHTAPVPVLLHEGRLYRAFEDNQNSPEWGQFLACVISADADADLLNADSWLMSNKVAFPAPLPAGCPAGLFCWLEGNVVADPDGQLWNILRAQFTETGDVALRLAIHDRGARLELIPGRACLPLPGALTKFVIRRDPVSGQYLLMGNPGTARNELALFASPDLTSWRRIKTLLTDPTGLEPELSRQLTGFQYPDWQFDGDDIIYLSRTALRGAHNFHDANQITFHTVKNFRKLLP